MIEMVEEAGKLVRLAVVHANALPAAEKMREALARMYKGPIYIYEARLALATHSGEGALGLAFQKA